ncbi:hypothetical protein SESBI_41353 [Sesbania bispinosa]|nr:hypothetical protein SESBI_41353 [Sesbania bispinosa]
MGGDVTLRADIGDDVYIPQEGPSGIADEVAADLGDPATQFHEADIEDDLDRIIRGD